MTWVTLYCSIHGHTRLASFQACTIIRCTKRLTKSWTGPGSKANIRYGDLYL